MWGQLCPEWALGVVWLFGAVRLGVFEPGDEAAMATAPHVPAAATAAVAAAVSSKRLDFGNRSPFSGSRDAPMQARDREKGMRAGCAKLGPWRSG